MTRLSQKGFTIVELLIVIVVIGILAAIVIVAFNGIQNRANDTSVRADLKGAIKQVEIWRLSKDEGAYPVNDSDLTAIGMKLSKGAYNTAANNITLCSNTTGFAIVARSKSGAAMYASTTTSGDIGTWTNTAATNCDNAGVSGGHQRWGYSSATSTWNFGI